MAGTLTRIGADSISLELNHKTRLVRVSAGTEIWRCGKDVASTTQLVPGERVYAAYTETAKDGTPIATIVAAAEGDDSISLIPNHIVERHGCGGLVEAVSEDMISVKSHGERALYPPRQRHDKHLARRLSTIQQEN